MGYRDELEALRVNHEIVSRELEAARAKAADGTERAGRLERELDLAKSRIAGLEDLLGGDLGERALRRRTMRRALTLVAVILVAGVGFMMKTQLERARQITEEAMTQSEQRVARAAACEAALEQARAESEQVREQYRRLFERFVGQGARDSERGAR